MKLFHSLRSICITKAQVLTWPSSHHFRDCSPLICHYTRCTKPSRNPLARLCTFCRDVKDTLISLWFFGCAIHKIELDKNLLESMFRSFCSGTVYYGPFWEHLLSYWRESLENPNHVLFMRYEEMKAKPRDQIKRLADFLDCPFTKEEEDSGSVDEILDLCSLRNLSSLEINKAHKTNNVDHKSYFRKGEVGDWKNYLTPEMENKIDMIIQEKLQGSGLKF